jgi:hypothetical protein
LIFDHGSMCFHYLQDPNSEDETLSSERLTIQDALEPHCL